MGQRQLVCLTVLPLVGNSPSLSPSLYGSRYSFFSLVKSLIHKIQHAKVCEPNKAQVKATPSMAALFPSCGHE